MVARSAAVVSPLVYYKQAMPLGETKKKNYN
jgi:hypothetical protein